MHERMLSRRRRDERGFTLPDMLGAMTLAIIAGTGAVTFIRAQSLALRVQAGQADLNDSSRGAIELMAREIRLAGYWPCGTSTTAPCAGACLELGMLPIWSAGAPPSSTHPPAGLCASVVEFLP